MKNVQGMRFLSDAIGKFLKGPGTHFRNRGNKPSRKDSRGRTLRHEPLEERNLLAVDSGLTAFSNHAFAEDTCDSSHISAMTCSQSPPIEETALVSSCLFLNDGVNPVYGPMSRTDQSAYEDYRSWRDLVGPEILQAVRETHTKKQEHQPSHEAEICLEDFPAPRTHGTITPLVFEEDSPPDEGGILLMASGGSGGLMASGGSGGGSGGSGGTSGGSGGIGHLGCNSNPWLSGGQGGASVSGGSGRVMMLASETDLVINFYASDPDEMLGYGMIDEGLQMQTSPEILSTITLEKFDWSYHFTMTIDISSPQLIQGEVWVVDTHGYVSTAVEINIEIIKINDFEYQEKPPGTNDFQSLEDNHVVWRENTNRFRFLTSRQIDYDDPIELAEFLALFDYKIKTIPWTWTGSTYVKSTNPWADFTGGLGVHSLKVELYKKGTTTKFGELTQALYYCFNAISSVRWVESPDYDDGNSHLKLYSSGGNDKVFVERTVNNTTGVIGPLKNIATVQVTLSKAIPAGLTGTVHLDWFDPNNPIGSTKTPTGNGRGTRDNHGTISSLTPNPLIFGANTLRKSVEMTIGGAHAGDNYIVAAHPNAGVLPMARIDASNNITVSGTPTGSGGSGGAPSGGGSNGAALPKTEVLTVWRTLWVECDQLENNGVKAGIPSVSGIPKNQYARACINLEAYPQTRVSKTIALEKIHAPLLLNERNAVSAKRTTPQATPELWTVHLIGAFWRWDDADAREDYVAGWAACGEGLPNTAFVYNKVVDDLPASFGLTSAEVSIFRERNIAHEIGHLMYVGHPVAPGIMAATNANNQVLSAYCKFTDDDIKAFQAVAAPR